jgi:hypothetical protein
MACVGSSCNFMGRKREGEGEGGRVDMRKNGKNTIILQKIEFNY